MSVAYFAPNVVVQLGVAVDLGAVDKHGPAGGPRRVNKGSAAAQVVGPEGLARLVPPAKVQKGNAMRPRARHKGAELGEERTQVLIGWEGGKQ